jgi:hypothetical protein
MTTELRHCVHTALSVAAYELLGLHLPGAFAGEVLVRQPATSARSRYIYATLRAARMMAEALETPNHTWLPGQHRAAQQAAAKLHRAIHQALNNQQER